MYAPLAARIAAEVKKLTSRPIQYIIDTHVHADHVDGNAVLAALDAVMFYEPKAHSDGDSIDFAGLPDG
jgi:glyoxylase-like metal-dependent hydrolase (beta-lactamase superfamily II)